MDPNANLAEQEQIAALPRYARTVAQQTDLASLRLALDVWLSGGGFAPDWSRCPHAAEFFGE